MRRLANMHHRATLLVAIPVAGRTVFVAVDLAVTAGDGGATLEIPAAVADELRRLAEALRILRARRVGV